MRRLIVSLSIYKEHERWSGQCCANREKQRKNAEAAEYVNKRLPIFGLPT